ncbi:MAG TPA: hypothetical protein VN026_05100 [Bacteroidia bacterium]|jgi:hypothetical protein|nr:hypothetical protein [Bacteroidia bacterium]
MKGPLWKDNTHITARTDFEAYELNKDHRVLKEDVDIRNDKSKNDNVRKPDPKKEKDLYEPKK